MATIQNKVRVRDMVRFLQAIDNSPTKIHFKIVSDYGKDIMSER